jgi:hypothetical protein
MEGCIMDEMFEKLDQRFPIRSSKKIGSSFFFSKKTWKVCTIDE